MRIVLASLCLATVTITLGCGAAHDTPSDCTAPCAGDPVDDFGTTQGGTNNRWRYLADLRSPNGTDYEEMQFGEVRGEPGWVSATGSSPAGILSCAENPDAQGCEGLESSLMFFPGTDTDPALAFVAAADGTYALTGKVQAATGNPEGLPQRFHLSRNSRNDLIDSKVHVTAPTPDDFAATVELLAGDRLILTFVGGQTDSVPVAFDYHLTLIADGAAAFPGGCKLGARFDGNMPFADPCRTTLENLNDEIGPAGMTAAVPSINADYGDARSFAFGQFMRSPGGPLDRTGDFTLQFWAKLDEPQEFQATMYSDWEDIAMGGVNLSPGETSGIDLCVMWHGASTGTECVTGTRPTDRGWHFYRVSRSMDEASVDLCVDGVLSVSDPNPGTNDMTGDQPPHIGRNVDFNPAYFQGAIDEVRAYTHALPCPTP